MVSQAERFHPQTQNSNHYCSSLSTIREARGWKVCSKHSRWSRTTTPEPPGELPPVNCFMSWVFNNPWNTKVAIFGSNEPLSFSKIFLSNFVTSLLKNKGKMKINTLESFSKNFKITNPKFYSCFLGLESIYCLKTAILWKQLTREHIHLVNRQFWPLCRFCPTKLWVLCHCISQHARGSRSTRNLVLRVFLVTAALGNTRPPWILWRELVAIAGACPRSFLREADPRPPAPGPQAARNLEAVQPVSTQQECQCFVTKMQQPGEGERTPVCRVRPEGVSFPARTHLGQLWEAPQRRPGGHTGG